MAIFLLSWLYFFIDDYIYTLIQFTLHAKIKILECLNFVYNICFIYRKLIMIGITLVSMVKLSDAQTVSKLALNN